MFPFAITQLFSGVISDMKGRFPVLIIGLLLFGVAMLIAALSFSLEIYAIANILGGIGFGFINPVLIALMTDISSPQNIPKKMGFLGASANLGVGLGPLIASQMILIGWQSIYILFVVISAFGLIYFILSTRPPQKVQKESGIKILLSQLSMELRRSVIILMVFSALILSHTYLAINIWTSSKLSDVVDETLVGLVLGLAGIGAAITGALTGTMIKKKGIGIPLVFGSVLLFVSLAILLLVGDITYYSQVLSPERRGALAGLLTAAYFVGIALVPTTLAPISEMFGITGIYLSILGISLLFVFILSLLYILAKRTIQ
ncbi:hypothetical protein ES703_30638 [subsurface metagenome]